MSKTIVHFTTLVYIFYNCGDLRNHRLITLVNNTEPNQIRKKYAADLVQYGSIRFVPMDTLLVHLYTMYQFCCVRCSKIGVVNIFYPVETPDYSMSQQDQHYLQRSKTTVYKFTETNKNCVT